MSSFDLIGGVGIMGVLSPMDTEDNYPVIDPLYGIDGLRNVDSVEELNLIPFERRRAGMIVGVFGGQKYFKLKNIDWLNEFSDWEELDFTKQIYIDKEKPIGEINAINKIFKLSKEPIPNSEHIYLNGVLQEMGDNYLIHSKEIIFLHPPQTTSRIRCSYRSL